MIRWCCGCQKYLGEVPPWNDYSVTHSLCPVCKDKYSDDDKEFFRRADALASFFIQLRASAQTGHFENVDSTLQKGIDLGIRPLDLMIGVIQPILHEIGVLWSEGKVTVATEHRFSAFSNAMIALIYARHPQLYEYRQSRNPQFLLVNAEDNYHLLGIQLVELCLAVRKTGSYTIIPGLPVSEVVQLARELQPGYVGLSVSLTTQMKSIREIISRLQEIDEAQRPKILIGGSPMREGLTLRSEFNVLTFRNLAEFDEFLDSKNTGLMSG